MRRVAALALALLAVPARPAAAQFHVDAVSGFLHPVRGERTTSLIIGGETVAAAQLQREGGALLGLRLSAGVARRFALELAYQTAWTRVAVETVPPIAGVLGLVLDEHTNMLSARLAHTLPLGRRTPELRLHAGPAFIAFGESISTLRAQRWAAVGGIDALFSFQSGFTFLAGLEGSIYQLAQAPQRDLAFTLGVRLR